MTKLEESLVSMACALEKLGVPFMLIGGMAVSLRQEPRTTLDVDLSLWVEPQRRDSVARALLQEFTPAISDPLGALRETNVLPLIAPQQIRADLVFATLDFERAMLARATPIEVGGVPVPVATVEDLILMKLVSERDKDRQDAIALVHRHGLSLDRAYLDPLLGELAEALYNPGLLAAYRDALGEDQ